MKYSKIKHTSIRRLTGIGALFGLAIFMPLRAESIAQAEIRAQASRFWKIAEDRVDLAPTAEPDEARAASPSPVRSLAPRTFSPSAPPPTVTVRQTVDRSTTAGHFGFSLFGGLRLFDFDWGETSQREHDALDGDL